MQGTIDMIIEYAFGSCKYELEDRFDRAFESGFLAVAFDAMKEQNIQFKVENIWNALVIVAMNEIFGSADYTPDFKSNKAILHSPESVLFLNEKKEMFYFKTGIGIE